MSDSIKLYEKFCKDNKLQINELSAEEFVDLYELENFDSEILSEEYTEYARTLSTKKARFNNMRKAYNICKNNTVAKILMYDSARNMNNNMVNLEEIPDHKYKTKKISFTQFLLNEIADEQAYLLKYHNYDRNIDNDMFTLGYEYRKYLWAYKRLYVNYIEQWELDDAIRCGEHLLALNPGDDFDIIDSLPFLYLNKGQYNEALIILNNKKMDVSEYYIVKAVVSIFSDDEVSAKHAIYELNKENKNLVDLIYTNYSPQSVKNIIYDDSDYAKACYVYLNALLMGDKYNALREFIIKFINIL